MPQDPRQRNNNGPNGMDPAEYRKQQRARELKRKKKRQQQMLVLGAFALAIIILVVCIVLVIRSIFKKDGDPSTSLPSSGITSGELGGEGGGTSFPTAANKSAWNLLLINEQHPVEDGFEYAELERVVQNGVEYWFDARMWPALEQMVNDCNAVEGHNLGFYAGFRSYNRQREKFQYFVDLYTKQGKSADEAHQMAKQHAEAAGTADNHTGLSVEFIVAGQTEPSEDFRNSSEYTWLQLNAASYGFILRYPDAKQAITGVPYSKPYQYRYVGVEEAKAISEAGICLEEYLSTPSTASPDPGVGKGSGLPEGEPTSLPEEG